MKILIVLATLYGIYTYYTIPTSGNITCSTTNYSTGGTFATYYDGNGDSTAQKFTFYNGSSCAWETANPLQRYYANVSTTSNTTTYTCTLKKATGAACSNDYECATGACKSGFCIELLANAGVCIRDNHCQSYFCRTSDYTCQTPLADGAECPTANYSLNAKCHPFGKCQSSLIDSTNKCYWYRYTRENMPTRGADYCRSGAVYSVPGQVDRCVDSGTQEYTLINIGNYKEAKGVQDCPTVFANGTRMTKLWNYASVSNFNYQSIYNTSENYKKAYCPYTGFENISIAIQNKYLENVATLTSTTYWAADYWYTTFLTNNYYINRMVNYIEPITCGETYEKTVLYPYNMTKHIDIVPAVPSLSLPMTTALLSLLLIILLI